MMLSLRTNEVLRNDVELRSNEVVLRLTILPPLSWSPSLYTREANEVASRMKLPSANLLAAGG